MSDPLIEQAVRDKYAEIARAAGLGHRSATREGGNVGCCGPRSCGCGDPMSSELYSGEEIKDLPPGAVEISLGCGNPTALIDLKPGQTVLDLGSGGGIDVLLSARRVGPTGKAYGLDMTDEMLARARENQRKAGITNAEFLEGTIDAIPLPDRSVDVVISNCVINLASDKDAVLREAFRVLKPGGRFAVADVVIRGQLPDQVRRSMELWVGCIAGALEVDDYESKLRQAGFEQISTEIWRTYDVDDAREFLSESGLDAEAIAREVDGSIASAFVRAQKPRTCCTSECCA
jgi:SAM-dependent methyltransferase